MSHGAHTELEGLHQGRETGTVLKEESDHDAPTEEEDADDMVSSQDDEEDEKKDGEGNGEGKDDDEQCDQKGGEVEHHDRRSSGENQEVLAAPIIVPSQPVIETTGITIVEET